MTLYEAPQLKEYINALLDEGNNKIIINFERVSFVDSSGLGVLIAALTRASKENGALKFYNVSEHLRKLLKLTKLETVFDIHESEEDSVNSLESA